ncbi:hypothetical protein [Saccharothrix coeruleofusca]|uniref:Uncharacterized protein n=1 Tax=Saccharothrix coeruleofusca TaxID=33919 RepID=A0A918AS52_9PSEU|nr:hypothetical protein [Saccharothrix coeruleofusca]GGP78386.1 hypothetical protein GCM10010185_60160 [Saccharothrix coeruleofusca]
MSGSDVRLVVSAQSAGFDGRPVEEHLATGGVDPLVLPLPPTGGERLRAERAGCALKGAVPAGACEAIPPESPRQVAAVEREQREPVFQRPVALSGVQPAVGESTPVREKNGS